MTRPQTKPSILIVDDDKHTREGLERALRRQYEVRLAESAHSALDLIESRSFDVLLSDVRMPGMDGLTLLQRVMARSPAPLCIMLTAYGSVETAVDAMKRGAYDFLTKPVDLDHLDLIIKRGLRSREMENENLSLQQQLDNKYGLHNIIGNSSCMAAIFDTIKQAAPSQATVLIQGESGTGKELVAQAVHRLSTRSRGPFVAVHCAALPSELLESELFGHEKGAFTGAHERREGRFEKADGGTLFLDEISEIDSSTQVKLLRVLEEREFERVGGDKTIDVDIRLVAATNKNLKDMVAAGTFREDLFYRLDVINITLPPLRDRADDIPLLCSHFVREFNEKNGKEVTELSPEVINQLSRYNWPGNVRELRNTIEKMVVLSRSNRLTPKDIPPGIRASLQEHPGPVTTAAIPGGTSMKDAERAMIESALEKCEGNRTRAAELLGISRRTLHRKLNQYEQEDGDNPVKD
jgi:DNA-binding NtrC family response regulator